MNSSKDYYAILGVSRNVKSAELKSAFRRLAITCHPDHHPGDRQAEDRFKELSEAYGVLSSPEKKARYDRTRSHGSSPQTGGPAKTKPGYSGRPFSPTRTSWKKPALKKTAPPQPNRVKSKLNTPDYAERVFAGLKNAPVKKKGEAAKYIWRKWLTKAKDKLYNLADNWGLWQEETESSCDLSHTLFISAEDARNGVEMRFSHQVDGKDREILLKVPPGIKDGARLRLAGQGESGPSGLTGDLILDISIKPR